MPPFKNIEPLHTICLNWVWRWLFHCLNYEATPQNRLKQRAYVLQTLNPPIRQQLLNYVCKAHMYQVYLESKCLLIELLGDKSTGCIDLSTSGFYYIDGIYKLYRTMTVGLMYNVAKLGFECKVGKDKKFVPDVNLTFHRLFNQMRNLRWVTLRGMCDETILGMLGSNCPHLEYLDVRNSPFVDDEGIASLILKDTLALNGRSLRQISRQELRTTALCKNLSFICVSGTNIGMLSALLLLHYLPKLVSFGTQFDCGSVCSIIKILQPDIEDEDQSTRIFKLKDLSEFKISPEDAPLISAACPDVTSFTIATNGLEGLKFFHSLKYLTVADVQCSFTPIYNYLQVKGESLSKLVLLENYNCPLDLAYLMEVTPNLEHLESCIFIEDWYEVNKWEKLKVATITVSASKVLMTFLKYVPLIKHLTIKFIEEPYCETSDCINDDLVYLVSLENSLINLEKLTISECAVSMKGVECLLIHCPELWYIGRLAFWPNVSHDEIIQLRLEAIQNNWKLRIVLRFEWESIV